MSDKQYQTVSQWLNTLQEDVGARCILLTDSNGRFIACTGDLERLDMEELASLLGGSVAAMLEVGRTLDNDEDAINLVYREGQNEFLYAISIGQQLMLILIIDRQAYSSRLGSVWYYARQTAVNLSEHLAHSEAFESPEFFQSDDLDQAFSDELDSLWLSDDDSADFGLADGYGYGGGQEDTAVYHHDQETTLADDSITPDADPFTPAYEDFDTMIADNNEPEEAAAPKLLSYEEALASQLIPENIGSM